MNMKQIYHHWTKWEDVKAGMWSKVDKDTELEMFERAVIFTGNHHLYGKAMMRAVKEWRYCIEHNLTDLNLNRRAYVGHCGVAIELGIPEYITRMAWNKLTTEQQRLANLQADKAIEYFELKLKNIGYAKTLFDN